MSDEAHEFGRLLQRQVRTSLVWVGANSCGGILKLLVDSSGKSEEVWFNLSAKHRSIELPVSCHSSRVVSFRSEAIFRAVSQY